MIRRFGRIQWVLIMMLISSMVGAQAHPCLERFVYFNGQECSACPTLVDQKSNAHQDDIDDNHGDCHDCCSVQSCGDRGKAKVVAFLGGFAGGFIDLPTTPSFFIPLLAFNHDPILVHQEGHPPTGPPSTTFGRAPPVSQMA